MLYLKGALRHENIQRGTKWINLKWTEVQERLRERREKSGKIRFKKKGNRMKSQIDQSWALNKQRGRDHILCMQFVLIFDPPSKILFASMVDGRMCLW